MFDRIFEVLQGLSGSADALMAGGFFLLLGLGFVFVAFFSGQGIRSVLGGFAKLEGDTGESMKILSTGISNGINNLTAAPLELAKGASTLMSTPSIAIRESNETERQRIAAETPEATITMRDGELTVSMKGPDANNRIESVVEATPKALNSPFFRRLPPPSNDVVDVEYSGSDSSGRSVFNLPNPFRR